MRRAAGPLVLVAGLASACAVALLIAARTAERKPAELGALEASEVPRQRAGGVHGVALALAGTAEAPRTPAAADPAAADALAGDLSTARTEHEFLLAFRALARRNPAALEALAASVFECAGPAAEKLALVRALREQGSSCRAAWEEVLARDSSAALAAPALQFLLDDAACDGGARAALARLAFETPLPDRALRRRAAAGFARHCAEPELAALDARLLAQDDTLLADGALASIAERRPSAARTRILLAHGRADERVEPSSEP